MSVNGDESESSESQTLPTHPLEIRVLVDEKSDIAPFEAWLRKLRDRTAKLRILTRLDRVQMGNMGDVKAVGEGVYELRLDYGPGYRLYFARVGSTIILLLTGGDKSSQEADIAKAKSLWNNTKGKELDENEDIGRSFRR